MVEQPSTSRGVATRDRILEAATAEFAEHGIAGARIERVVQAARTNKAQLYGYFGNKDGLFEAVMRASFETIMNMAPIGDDLADWAVRLYDEYLVRPESVRLATWTRLEKRPAGHLALDGQRVDREKLALIAQLQQEGKVREGEPFDLMAMVIGMSMAWSPVSGVYAATPDEPASEHDRRRTLLYDCVQRAVAARPERRPNQPSIPSSATSTR